MRSKLFFLIENTRLLIAGAPPATGGASATPAKDFPGDRQQRASSDSIAKATNKKTEPAPRPTEKPPAKTEGTN